MAHEPLRTDEKLETPVPRPRDMDAQMLVGCTGFVLASIGGYLLTVWPFFVFSDVQFLRVLAIAAAAGMIPAAIYGGIATRRFGLPGACGFFAGAVATAIFLVLRLQQVFVAAQAQQDVAPNYPPAFQYLVPVAWLLAALLVAALLLPKGELPGPGE